MRISHESRVGVVLRTTDGLGRIKWDMSADGSQAPDSWEEMSECKRVAPLAGDAFLLGRSGMGAIPNPTFPENPVAKLRDKLQGNTSFQLAMLESVGLAMPKISKARVISRERQLTLDIRKRTLHGAWVKGGCNGRIPGKLQLALAKVIATGVPICAAETDLAVATSLHNIPESRGWAAKYATFDGKDMSRKQKRLLRKHKALQGRVLDSSKDALPGREK